MDAKRYRYSGKDRIKLGVKDAALKRRLNSAVSVQNIDDYLDEHGIIKMLAKAYPKCFFEDPARRIPIKRGIVDDLHEDGFIINKALLLEVIDFYENCLQYLQRIRVGHGRIDINGSKSANITRLEATIAIRKIQKVTSKAKTTSQKDFGLRSTGLLSKWTKGHNRFGE